MLNRNDESGHLSFVHDFREKAFSLSPLNIVLAMGLSSMICIIMKHVPSISTFSSVQSLSHVWLFLTPWIAACQASLPITKSQSSFRLTSTEPMMPSSHLILCHPLLLLPPTTPSIRVLSNESTLCIRWPKYWSFSFSISPSNDHPGLILGKNLQNNILKDNANK